MNVYLLTGRGQASSTIYGIFTTRRGAVRWLKGHARKLTIAFAYDKRVYVVLQPEEEYLKDVFGICMVGGYKHFHYALTRHKVTA